MFISKLITKNFKKLSSTEIVFNDGLNLLCGENAQGKTTVLEAIEAALFGFACLPCKKEHIPTWGQKEYSVELHFKVGLKKLVAFRSHNNANLKIDGELLANGNTATTSAIVELLGINAKDFNFFIKSSQGETTGILNFGATELVRKVEEFGGIGRIDRLIRQARTEATTAKKVLERIPDSEDIQTIEEKLDVLTTKKAELEAIKLNPPTLLAEVKPPVSAKELIEKVKLASNTLAEIETINAEIAAKQATIAELNAIPVEYTEANLERAKESLSTISGATAAAKEKLDEKKALLNKQKSIKTIAESKLAEIEVVSTKLTEAKNNLESYCLSELVKTHNSLKTKQLELKHDLQHCRAMLNGSKCNSCGTVLKNIDIAAEQEKQQTILKDIQEVESSLVFVSADLKKAEQLEATKVSLSGQLKTLYESVSSYKEFDIAALEDEIADIETHLDSCLTFRSNAQVKVSSVRAALDQIKERKDRVLALSAKITSLNLKLERLSANLVGVPTQDDIELANLAEVAFNEVKQANLQAQYNYSVAVKELQVLIAENAKEIEEVKQEIENKKVYDETAFEVEAYSAITSALTNNRAKYNADIWKSIVGFASRQVAISSGNLITEIEYTNGEVFFTEDGITQPIASASGAQKAHIGTAIRIALCSVLYSTKSLVIFDEPTESMSEKHALMLVSSLANLGRQCILITHRDKDQSLANHLIQIGE